MKILELDDVIERLDFDDGEDLIREGDEVAALSAARRYAWSAAHERLGIQAAYFEGRVPLVYFAGLQIPNDNEVEHAVARLHAQTWNQSRAQLLVVVLPTEVRILDGRAAPRADPLLLSAQSVADSHLEPFTRGSLLAARGELPGANRHVKPVVLQLREDLRPTRERLLADGMPVGAADQLLARCLFAQYLDARGLMASIGVGGDGAFLGLLHRSMEETYRLFDALRERFNGDTFAISKEERDVVAPEHLHTIASFLEGSAGSGQLTLIPRYDFSVIPAEVLGGVYEEFIRVEQQNNAAFYTPRQLVDACLDEAMPVGQDLTHANVLDPACGSGLFLARAYERLLDHLEDARERPLSAREMADVLANQLHGCDLMADALRVAALSCYLVLLDRLANTEDGEWQFPRMVGRNLHEGDFFELVNKLKGPFDVIASNPPWKNATPAAKKYLRQRELPAGSKLTLAEAFFWAGVDRLDPDGQMALLMPAGSLYKQSPNERAFQAEALLSTGIDLIVDLSAFRHQLFADASAPCALCVVRGEGHQGREHLTFAAPKPGPVSTVTGRIALDAERIIRVPRRELRRSPGLLRRLVFGDMRDAHLIDRLTHMSPRIGGLFRRGAGARAAHMWTAGLGYQINGGERHSMALLNEIPTLNPDGLLPFGVELKGPLDTEWFHRPRNPELYDGPRVLLARAVDSDGIVRAAYYDGPASFNETIIAYVPPAGGAEHALALCGYLNSSLARYLLFMTGSSWGIERPQLKQQDVKALPVPFLDYPEQATVLADLTRSASPEEREGAIGAIDKYLATVFALNDDELALIDDRLGVQLAAFNDPLSAAAHGLPGSKHLAAYSSTLQRALTEAIGSKAAVQAELDGNDVLVSIGFAGKTSSQTMQGSPLGWQATPSETLLIRRPQRTYGRDWCELRKFAERKEVTAAAALHDADEILGELLRAATRREAQEPAGW
jgi:methylase of polypeptide subunit release factors